MSSSGDIILLKRSGWLGWFVSLFTGSDYVHVGIDMGDGTVAHVYPFLGKRFDLIEDWESGETIRLSMKIPLATNKLENLLFYIRAVKVFGYDYYSAIKSWFWKSKNDEKPTGNRYQCGEFVSGMYRKGADIDLLPNRSDDSTQPQDFLLSPFLYVVHKQ